MPTPKRRPSQAELEAAVGNTLSDVIAPGLRVLFCGINPGLYSALTGHHFARPGNRFWPALYAAGFTSRLLDPTEERELLALGYGITNLAARATVAAAELTPAELVAGGHRLAEKVAHYQPRFVAFLGVGAYRTAFAQPQASYGRQPEPLHGAVLWVLPSPSGLNAHFKPADLARLFAELRAAEDATS
jgi:double-stranded uracil-DNA glycosylase